MVPPATASPDRVAAWQEDIDTLVTGFLPRDLSFIEAERYEFKARLAKLRARVADLTDDEVIVEMGRAVAGSGNAHTRLYLLRNRTRLSRLPIRVYPFKDGLYVVRTDAAHRALLGRRVEAIEGVPIAEVLKRVAPVFAGNAAWHEYVGTYLVTSPEILRGVGVLAKGSNAPRFTVRPATGGARTEAITGNPLEKVEAPTEAWWDLSPLHPGRFGPWEHALGTDSTSLPLYLRHPTQFYWFTRLAPGNALYFQFNRAANDPNAETVHAFGARLLDTLAANPPAKLIVDVRFNTGGDLTLADSLLRAIAALSLAKPAGRIFVITSRTTFSAGITAVVELKQFAGARIAGEPAGDGLTMWSEGGNVILPNSGIPAHYGNGFHNYDLAPPPPGVKPVFDLGIRSLAPDLPAPLSWRDYQARRDPALERILAAH